MLIRYIIKKLYIKYNTCFVSIMEKKVMYKISVIMPIYNAENDLPRSISSIINQTMDFKDIELILVDDNSRDGSKRIMEDYASKYSNIKCVFLEENHGGPSIPRNVGIKESSADYIMFIDNDDEYDSQICEIFYNKINQYDVDCVNCNVREISVSETVNHPFEGVFEEIFWEDDAVMEFQSYVIWNKIYKKDIILENNIKFPNYRNEDWYFSFMYYVHCKSLIYLSNYYGYYYLLNSDSLSKGSDYNQLYGVLEMSTNLCKELREMNIDPMYYFNSYKHTSLIYSMTSKRFLNEPNELIYDLFEKYVDFEEELNCSEKRGLLFDIGKSLLMNRKFFLAKLYFKMLAFPKRIAATSPFIKTVILKFR